MAEAHIFQPVGEDNRRFIAGQTVTDVDKVRQLLLFHNSIDFFERDLRRNDIIQQHPSSGALHALAVDSDGDRRLEIHLALIVGNADFRGIGEQPPAALGVQPVAGHIVKPQHDVLGRHDDRLAVGRRQDVVGRHHERARFHLRFHGERHVHRHLVAVEVGVIGGAYQRMKLNRFAIDENRLEGLDAKPVQRRRAVEQDRMLTDDFIEDVPHFGHFALDHFFGALDGRDKAALFELVVDKGFEKLEGHLLRQPALVQPKFGSHDNHRAA